MLPVASSVTSVTSVTVWFGPAFAVLLFVGAVVGGGLMLFFGKDRKYAVPFGPFLALGALVYIFSGESIIEWYLISMSPG